MKKGAIHVEVLLQKLGLDQKTFSAEEAVFSDQALQTISMMQK